MNTNTLPDLAAEARNAIEPVLSVCAKPAAQVEKYMRQHPGGTLLAAAGFGIAAVLLFRALTPAPPRNRAVRLLEEIQQRLASLAEDSTHAMNTGIDAIDDLHLDRKINNYGRKFTSLFN
ncbi:MAG: hypothetical protein ABL974_16325 [Prosthecobacter sp.]